MRTRIITAIVALCIFVPVCIFSDTIVLEFAMAVLNVVAVYELWHCIRGTEETPHEIGSMALWIPHFLVAAGGVFLPRSCGEKAMYILFLALFLLLLYTFAVVVFSRGKIQITDAAVLMMMTLYVTASFTSILCLRRGESGAHLFLLPFIGAWVSDTFAYFTGRLLGKHKLIPEVSPKKTVEGAVGGIVFTGVAYGIFGVIIGMTGTGLILLVGSGFLISVISQIGDLIASVVKRYYGIKDYGKLFPGHGGVMDRFDSVIATAPVLYTISILFPTML